MKKEWVECKCVREFTSAEDISVEYRLFDPEYYPGCWAKADCPDCHGVGIKEKERITISDADIGTADFLDLSAGGDIG